MKFIYDHQTGKAHIEEAGKVLAEYVCFDIKLESAEHSIRAFYWPKTKKLRREAEKVFLETGKKPPQGR